MPTERSAALIESLWLALVGMGGVFASLALLAGLFAGLSALDRWLTRWRTRRAALPAAVPPAPALPGAAEAGVEQEEEELVAVLAAAASVALRRRVKVRSVQRVAPGSGNAWAAAGRLSIMASHAIDRRKG